MKALDIGAVLVLLGLAVWQRAGGRIMRGSVTGYVLGLAQAGWETAIGIVRLAVQDVAWRSMPRGSGLRRACAVGVRLALAAPLLLVFGGLFVSADAAFKHLVVDLFDVDLEEALGHMLFTTGFAWVAAGYLRTVQAKPASPVRAQVAVPAVRLGPVEVGVVLTCVNLLFLAFIAVQVRYFFGGAARVEIVPGLTYAEYARRGFFELVTVVALVSPLLLVADWLLRHEQRRRTFRVLAGTLVGLLFVIMLSAGQRMRLYQHEYGLTELRLYTSVFMVWLALVFAWFVATVLRGRREYFAGGALAAGLGMVALLHMVSPDAWIARANLARADQGLDVPYVASLSADAGPVLVGALGSVNDGQRRELVQRLQERWPAEQFTDWRRASIARVQAERALERLDRGARRLGR